MFERLARTNTGSGFPEIVGESGSAAPSVLWGFASLAGRRGRKDARNPSTNINKAKATHSQKKICIGGGWRATTSEATVQMSFHSAAIADAPLRALHPRRNLARTAPRAPSGKFGAHIVSLMHIKKAKRSILGRASGSQFGA
jgi:hypothetical protein